MHEGNRGVLRERARQIMLSATGLEEAQFRTQLNPVSEQAAENKELEAAGPVSRIRRAALQTEKLFEISRCKVSMMSTLTVMAGFASHRRHNVVARRGSGKPTPNRPPLQSLEIRQAG